jgi:hypothetical protein
VGVGAVGLTLLPWRGYGIGNILLSPWPCRFTLGVNLLYTSWIAVGFYFCYLGVYICWPFYISVDSLVLPGRFYLPALVSSVGCLSPGRYLFTNILACVFSGFFNNLKDRRGLCISFIIILVW